MPRTPIPSLAGLTAHPVGSRSPEKPQSASAPLGPTISLTQLALRQPAQVSHLGDAAGRAADALSDLDQERLHRLAEIGFTPGETVRVLARSWPGGDPLVVAVGHSRFALRKAEADGVWVRT